MPKVPPPAKAEQPAPNPEVSNQPVELPAAAATDNQATSTPTSDSQSSDAQPEPEPDPGKQPEDKPAGVVIDQPGFEIGGEHFEQLGEAASKRAMEILANQSLEKPADQPAADSVPASLSGASSQPAPCRRAFVFVSEDGPVTVDLDRLPVHCIPVRWALKDKDDQIICEHADGVGLQEDADCINRNFVQPE